MSTSVQLAKAAANSAHDALCKVAKLRICRATPKETAAANTEAQKKMLEAAVLYSASSIPRGEWPAFLALAFPDTKSEKQMGSFLSDM